MLLQVYVVQAGFDNYYMGDLIHFLVIRPNVTINKYLLIEFLKY